MYGGGTGLCAVYGACCVCVRAVYAHGLCVYVRACGHGMDLRSSIPSKCLGTDSWAEGRLVRIGYTVLQWQLPHLIVYYNRWLSCSHDLSPSGLLWLLLQHFPTFGLPLTEWPPSWMLWFVAAEGKESELLELAMEGSQLIGQNQSCILEEPEMGWKYNITMCPWR